MELNNIKYELQNLISGKSGASYDALIQTVSKYLGSGSAAGPMAEEKHQNKPKEAIRLIEFAKTHRILISDIPLASYISSGAEQKVYISGDHHVIKLNDAIYYASWEDYFHSLLLHNYFFGDTAYELAGFHLVEDQLHAVVRQRYVKADQITDLKDVNSFLEANGFKNSKNHDYYHRQLGIIIEDLHDENVLCNNGMLYFIDTVFYIEPEIFWKQSKI